MRFWLRIACLSSILILLLSAGAFAQSGRRQTGGTSKKNPTPDATPAPTPADTQPANIPADVETVRVETNLVTVPVIISDRNDRYIADMQQSDFTLEEDGVRQEIVFFGTTTIPFHVVLMLDTSASTEEKLSQIQSAAIAFVNQLQPADRIKIISFDDEIRDYGDFTNDRRALRAAISLTRPGKGTKLYDAMDRALAALKRIEGRKAIVIFTDGVDWHSDRFTIDSNRRELEEAGVIVYPIRYDTREETERLARRQAREGQTVDLGTIFGGGQPRNTTPTTVPGGTIPLPGRTGGSGWPTIVLPRRNDPRTSDPNRRNDPTQSPGRPDDPTRPNTGGVGDDIDAMLDLAYATADGYLNDLANITGGRLNRADTLGSLPAAFAKIADELRTQYSLGYYPTNPARDGQFRKIRVRSTRKGVVVRARPGYRAPS